MSSYRLFAQSMCPTLWWIHLNYSRIRPQTSGTVCVPGMCGLRKQKLFSFLLVLLGSASSRCLSCSFSASVSCRLCIVLWRPKPSCIPVGHSEQMYPAWRKRLRWASKARLPSANLTLKSRKKTGRKWGNKGKTNTNAHGARYESPWRLPPPPSAS